MKNITCLEYLDLTPNEKIHAISLCTEHLLALDLLEECIISVELSALAKKLALSSLYTRESLVFSLCVNSKYT